MAAKFGKNELPTGHSPEDFQCFGPACVTDGDFESCKIADLGCFTQDSKDSNKFYHAAIVQSKKNKQYYVYFEWGRTGGSSTFQMVSCASEDEAQREFSKQLHDKNDKRGRWMTVAGMRTLQAKSGKDCYLVRPMATRSIGLPDAKTIKEGIKITKAISKSTNGHQIDNQTLALMRDLNVATVSYTRGAMADASLPTQKSIDEARQILQEAQKRLVKVGDKVENQVGDKDLMALTTLMYSRIPKKKELRAKAEEWILNKNNIMVWTADLDAFSSALQTVECSTEVDPLAGMPLKMEWVSPTSELGKFLYSWWPKATANRHGGIGSMKIKNIWKVDRDGEKERVSLAQDNVIREKPIIKERPLFQPPERKDLNDAASHKKYSDSNTALLAHGSRSINISGILREGLRLPKELVSVVITGAAFGSGIYAADDWKKSAGYTSLHNSYWSNGNGTVKGREAFMFACDVVLGCLHVAPHSHGYTSPPKGHHSVFGKAGVSGVMNNEFIIYNTKQICLKYLLEFSV